MAVSEENTKLKEKALKSIEKCKSAMEKDQLQNAEKMKRYQREPYGNEIKGRSSTVMSDVFDTVEWIMPSLMKIFYGSEDVVTLSPQGPEDEEKAKLLEQKVNYDFQQGMPGFEILYDFFKDALLQKKGVIKYRWEKTVKFRNKEYEGLNEIEFISILNDPDVEILEHVQEGAVHNVKVKKRIRVSRPVMENLPSEEFIYDPTSPSLARSEFAAHRKKIKKAELKKYNITSKEIDEEISAFSEDPAYRERFNDLGGIDFLMPDKDGDDLWLYECYLNDYDEGGNKIPKKLTLIGNKQIDLEDSPFDKPPFCVCSPLRVPHRMVGMDIAELVMDIQKLRTALMRYIMDNIYFQNNGMKVVNPFRINVDQLLNNNVPGGIATTILDTNPNEAIYPVPISPLPPYIMNIAEYVEGSIKENRTGVTKYNQGLDSRSLNRTATGVTQIMSAAQQRIELIARIFAESEDGVKGIFKALVNLNLMYFDRKQNVKLNEKWISLGPNEIDGNFDVIIDIGTGTGSKEMKFNQLSIMFDKYAVAAPMLPDMITKRNIYNLFSAMWENLGFKNVSAFITEVQEAQAMPGLVPEMPLPPEMAQPGIPPQPPVPPPPPPPMMEQGPAMPPMQPPMPNLPMPMQGQPMMPPDLMPHEARLMMPPPPMPPEPGIVVNVAPPTVNIASPSVNISSAPVNVDIEMPPKQTRVIVPYYDSEGKITKIVSELTE